MRKEDLDEIEDFDDWDYEDDYQEDDELLSEEFDSDDDFFDEDYPEESEGYYDEEYQEEDDPEILNADGGEEYQEPGISGYSEDSEYSDDRTCSDDESYSDDRAYSDYDDAPEREVWRERVGTAFPAFGRKKVSSRRHMSFRDGRMSAFAEAVRDFFDAVRLRLTEMDRMDRIVALTGAFVAVIALATCSMYVQAQSVRKQVSSFTSVGDSMNNIEVIGEAGISAVKAAARVRSQKAEEAMAEALIAEAEESSAEESAEDSGPVTVKLKVTTIQSDLKIKFVDSSRGKLIEGVSFEAEAKSPEETLELKDDDRDGIIYVKNVKNGKYSVSAKSLTGSDAAKYMLPMDAQAVTVTDTIAYKKVDVADEIKSESQVNAKAEDTAKNDTVVESSLTDTVAWVESTKTEGGEVTYNQTSSIAIPEAPGGESETLSSNGEETNSDNNKGGNALTDTDGNRLYYHNGTDYVEATWQDYWNDSGRAYYTKSGAYVYTGWQTIGGYTYFFTADHNFVTGEQIIQGAKYNFDSLGHLQASSGQMGIDVSKWNGHIDWAQVKNSGVSFAIIRCGYRGSSTGALIEDPTFRTNISGAKAAGISVGIYFFTQAINEAEAVEEASMAVTLASGYGLNLPIYMDVESSGGRGDALSTAERTSVCSAFLRTVQSSGYSGGIYGNKTWLTSKIATSSLSSYSIWLAQYAAAPTYTATRYDIWQYSSKGRVSGISGNVDMNIRFR